MGQIKQFLEHCNIDSAQNSCFNLKKSGLDGWDGDHTIFNLYNYQTNKGLTLTELGLLKE